MPSSKKSSNKTRVKKSSVQPKKLTQNYLTVLITTIIIFILTISLYLIPYYYTFKDSRDSVTSSKVLRVIDGDTFVLSSGEKVRLICVNAPEKDEQGYESSKQFLENLILNKNVKLKKDISDKDKYGRLLRYVYVNDLFVNKELVRSGHAKVYPFPPDITLCDYISQI